MKTTKLIMGIISIVLCAFVLFQSCAAGLSNALQENGESGGSAGVIVAFCLLVAGIIGIVTRNGKPAGAYVAGGFYIFASIIGFSLAGSYGDLVIWSVVSLAFGATFIIGTVVSNKKLNK